MDFERLILLGSALLLVSVLVSQLSSRFGVPALLIFLAVGMAAGSDGPGGLYFDNAFAAQSLGVTALIVILFAGGLSTDWPSVRPILGRGIALATVGVVATAFCVGLFAMALLGFSPIEGLLLGAIVSATDAAAVFSVLKSRSISLKREIQPLLELESGSNDPMAVFLTLSLIRYARHPDEGWTSFVLWFLVEAAVGAAVGMLAGKGIATALRRLKLEFEGLYPVLVLAAGFFAYGLAAALHGSGFLAVYLAGLVLAKEEFPYKKSLIRFHDGVAWLMQIAMFVVLGLLVYPSRMAAIALPATLLSLFLLFVARPAGVMLSLLFARMTVNEKRMVAWVGLRGAAPIILATFPLLAKMPRAPEIFDIVFFIVLTSVLLQGTSVPAVARWLKVTAPAEKKRRYPIEFEATKGVDTDLIEFMVPYNAWAAGKPIFKLGLPEDCLVTLICREENFITATGKTVLEEGDVVLALVRPETAKKVQDILSRQKP